MKAAKRKGGGKKAAKQTAVKIQVEPSQVTPIFYANYVEVGHTQYDFVLTAARLPGKLGSARQAEVIESGVISLEPEVQITLPSELMRPLAEAILKQADAQVKTISAVLAKGKKT